MKYIKPTIFAILIINVALVFGQLANPNKKKLVRPTILFLTTDYTRAADLPVTGAPFLKAPAIEKLCNEGAVFRQHSCVSPICMPARASIVTGHYPHSHGLWDNRSVATRKGDRAFLISELKECGYQTVGIGKMHFYPRFADYDYDIRVSLEGKDVAYRNDDYEKYLESKGTSRRILKEENKGNGLPSGQSYADWTFDEELHADAFVGNKALEVIEKKQLSDEKPWFMWVSFTGPHNPWNAPKRWADYYRAMTDLPNGEFVEGELDNKPIDYTRHRFGYGGDLMRIYDKSSETQKKEIRHNTRASHYGLLSFIDEYLQRIIAELEKQNKLNNTLIIFTSDHGSGLFDNDMLHKGASFPMHSLVPFVAWAPGYVEPGMRDHFSNHVDLYATFMELAGVENVKYNEGRSMVSMFYSDKSKVNEFNIIESTMVTSIMTDNWLAGFHHITGEKELYNRKADPMCHYNLVNDEESKEIILTLEEQLVDWRRTLAGEHEIIGEDVTKWRSEIGDSALIQKYFKGYMKSFNHLANMPDSAVGKTGKAAKLILEASSNLVVTK